MYRQNIIVAIIIIGCGLIANGLGIAFTVLPSYAVPTNHMAQAALHQNSQPDLIIESITLNPTTLSPDAEGNITGEITVIIKNQGDATSGGYRVYLYVDPVDTPPNQTTAETKETLGLGIPAGLTNQWRLDMTFTTVDPVIYAWVDRNNAVTEADENNNILRYPELVETPTYTPTSTPTYSATPTPTDVPPTSTATYTATSTPTDIPPTTTYTPTSTDVPPTHTATHTPTATATPTTIYTETAPPTNTATSTATPTETDTAVYTATPTETATETATDTPSPTATPTANADSYTPIPTATDSLYPSTPDPESTVTATATDDAIDPTITPGDTAAPTQTPNNAETVTSIPTDTPILAPTDTPTLAPTDTPTPGGGADEGPEDTPTPSPSPTFDPCAAVATEGILSSGSGGQNQPYQVFLPVTSNGSRMIAPTVSPVNNLDPSVTEIEARATSEPLRIADTAIDLIEFPNGIAPTDGSAPNARFRTNFEEGVTPPGPTFEIWVTDDGLPTVMRDDGCGGDEVPNDGIYTAEVVLTQDELDLVNISKDPLDRIDDTDTIDIFKELMIVKAADNNENSATSVVDDPERTFDLCNARGNPDGVWAFKTLIMDMANTDDEAVAADFVEDWWRIWGEDITLSNGHNAEERDKVIEEILDKWERDGDKLDLDASPFRLLAIVTRLDLRNNPTPTTGHAGEFRFVWGVLEPDDPCAGTREFTIIFEYAMPAQNTTQLLAWAKQIHALQSLDFGPEYNEALEAISLQITARNVMSDEPNGSAINQVRTNEIINQPWELREFVLSETDLLPGTQTRRLVLTTVKQTPDDELNNTAELLAFLNENENALLHKDPVTGLDAPLHVVTEDLLGAKSLAETGRPWRISAPVGTIDNEVRHQFALMTCNGCHTLETGTAFLHVGPRPSLVETVLSDFLLGGTARDPIDRTRQREFNDLERRQNDLLRVLHSTRFEIVGLPGLRSRVH